MALHRAIFLVLAVLSLTPWASPALALGAGVALALTLGNPFGPQSAKLAKQLLQAAVVGLGFGMPLDAVWRAGLNGVHYTMIGIGVTLFLGFGLGKLLRVEGQTSTLITTGTSICGGSAIAAVGPAIGARPEAMSVALATVFMLNAVALYAFPAIGHALDMSQRQFAVWTAVAIHDTSSVVGAASAYGPIALEQATVLKLARALWIVPMALVAGAVSARGGKRPAIPWFIGLFVLAAAVRSGATTGMLPALAVLTKLAKTALVLTLFLIGSGLSRSALKSVGLRPLAQGVLLWLMVSVMSAFAVLRWVVA